MAWLASLSGRVSSSLLAGQSDVKAMTQCSTSPLQLPLLAVPCCGHFLLNCCKSEGACVLEINHALVFDSQHALHVLADVHDHSCWTSCFLTTCFFVRGRLRQQQKCCTSWKTCHRHGHSSKTSSLFEIELKCTEMTSLVWLG